MKAEAKRALLVRAASGEARCIQGSDGVEQEEQGLGAIIVARLRSLGEWGHQSRHGAESCGPEAL